MNVNADVLRVIKPYLDALETRIKALEDKAE